jgi:hypothetical protein
LTPPPAGAPGADAEAFPLGAGFDFTDPHAPLARFYLRPAHAAAAAVLGLVYVLINYVPLWHTDIWGHLKYGRWVAENGRLPQRDPFCPLATFETESIHYCWLGQAGLYLVYHAGEVLAGGDALRRMEGGVELLRFGHSLLVVLRCAVLLLAFRRLTGSLPLACAGLVLLLALSIGNIAVLRPQVLGEFFFALVLLALSRPVPSRRAVVLLPLVLALWANCHGSYAAGLLLLGTVLAGRTVAVGWAAGFRSPAALWRDAGVRRLLAALALSVAAVAVLNPSGPRIFANTLAMARHPNVLVMDEWQPLSFRLAAGGQWAFLATLVLLAGSVLWSRRPPSATAVLLTAVFAVQPLRHQRLLVWWLVLTPWLVLPHWAAVAARRAVAGTGGSFRPSLRTTLLAATLAVIALSWSIPVQWLLAGRPGPLDKTLFYGTPWRLAAQLQEPADGTDWLPALRDRLRYYPNGRFTGLIFPSETLGDYLVWALDGRTPVLVYTHVHLFPPEHWQLVAYLRSGAAETRSILERCRVNLVVVEPELSPRLCELLRKDPDWQVVVDEAGLPAKPDKRGRHFIALRNRPR